MANPCANIVSNWQGACMTVVVRIPRAIDAERIARVHVGSWRESYAGIVPAPVLAKVNEADRAEKWRGYVELAGFRTFLAEVDGEPAGFIHSGPLSEPLVDSADAHIYTLYVLSPYHRQGLGRRLLGVTAATWHEQGGRAISVGVLTQNQRARAFYEAMGARFVRPDTFEWDGHVLDESIYLFENMKELSRSA